MRALASEQNGISTPLSAHRWLLEWWRAYAADYEVRVFCAHDNGRLVAALPVSFGPATLGGVKMREAAFLGSRWGGFDLPARTEGDWVKPFLEWLCGGDVPNWHFAQLGPLLSRAVEHLGLTPQLTRQGLRYKGVECPKPFLFLGVSWEAFLATKSRNFRRTIKRKQQKMQADGGFEITQIRSPSALELNETVNRLSTASWQGHEGVAVAATPAGRTFYERISADDSEFSVELCVLRRNGICIAYLLGIIHDGAYHALDTAFDPGCADYSPGLVVHFEVLSKLPEQGVSKFEFGYDNAYKLRFDPEYRSFCDILVFRNSIVHNFARLIDKVKRARAWYHERRRPEVAATPVEADASQE